MNQLPAVAGKFSAVLLLVCSIAYSQTAPGSNPEPAPASAPPAVASPTWSVGPIDFSGLVDGYFSYSANHPVSIAGGPENQLRNFDYEANTFSLNMAKLTMSHDADPVGFRVDIGFGRPFTSIYGIHGNEPNIDVTKYLEQAYVSWKPAKAKGFQADFGDFVTSAGAEVIETKDNWNYSRSFLFSLAIPYYHFGLRTSMPLSKTFTAGVQVVNGWNNIEDNNGGKTIGITGALTKAKYTWNVNYYVGPENTNTTNGYRNLLDTTLLLTPTSKFNAYLNYDYGQNRNANAQGTATTNLVHWQGFAGALHYQATGHIAISGRGEYYADLNGFTTGLPQRLNEVTITGEYKWPEGLLARLEYRNDHSDQNFFNRGHSLGVAQNQSTLEVGIVAFFGPKR